MSDSVSQPAWLDRLSSATTYRELSAVFQEIRALPGDARNSQLSAQAIDLAIQRMLAERARDEAELTELQSRYQEFRDQQKGVVGWFKRHLPFSETRQQDRSQQAQLSNQQAEILADNLIIARAQMLKERWLPVTQRRLGHSASEWSALLEQCQSIAQINEYANHLVTLGQELLQSRQFIEAVEHDLDAFREADFTEKQDRQQFKIDLQQATDELKALQQEVAEETKLRREGLKQAGMLVSQELADHDVGYYAACQRIDLLGESRKRLFEASATIKDTRQTLERMHDASERLAEIPNQQANLRAKIEQARDILEDAERRDARSQAAWQATVPEMAHARQRLEQSRQQLQSLKSQYDAYVQSQQQAGVADAGNAQDSSAVTADYRQAELQVQQADREYQSKLSPHDTAKRIADDSARELATAKKTLHDLRKQFDQLQETETQLRKQFQNDEETLRGTMTRAAPKVALYLSSLQPLSWSSALENVAGPGMGGFAGEAPVPRSRPGEILPPLDPWSQGVGSPTLAKSPTVYFQQLHAAFDEDDRQLHHEVLETEKRRRAAWIQRCTELLPSELVKEVIQD